MTFRHKGRPIKLTPEQLEVLLEEWAALPRGGKMQWYRTKAAELDMSQDSLERYMRGYRPQAHLLAIPHAAYTAHVDQAV